MQQRKVVDTLKSSDTWGTAKSIDDVTASRDQLKADIAANADYNKYKKERLIQTEVQLKMNRAILYMNMIQKP